MSNAKVRRRKKMSYQATNDDLPAELLLPPQSSKLPTARERIRVTASQMGIELSPDSIDVFALVLIGIEDDRTQ
jgi:hypothetical protein